ncbi:MAG: hypothetical protein WBN18_14755 [Flavobacteriaceae bacterium]
MGTVIRITLLLTWLIAVCAPSVISLILIEKPVIVNNLNEEEPHEQVKKLQPDEFISNAFPSAVSLLACSKKSTRTDFYLLGHPNHTLEIFRPPPKSVS